MLSEKFVLTEENFEMYAMRAYEIPCLSVDDFYDDLKRIKYIKRLINRFKAGGDLKERLVLNHIIVLANVFGVEHATRIIFFRLEEKLWPQVKTFLTYLNYMPEKIEHVRSSTIYSSDIGLDSDIANILRKL